MFELESRFGTKFPSTIDKYFQRGKLNAQSRLELGIHEEATHNFDDQNADNNAPADKDEAENEADSVPSDVSAA